MQKCHRRECGGHPACDRARERTVLPGSGPFLPSLGLALPLPRPGSSRRTGTEGEERGRSRGHGGREDGVNALGLHNTEALSRAASAL